MFEVGVIGLVMLLLSLLGIVWDIASGLITAGIDGIFLLLVCLMIGAVFSLQLLYTIYQRRRSAHATAGK
jgi:hypothetical protein